MKKNISLIIILNMLLSLLCIPSYAGEVADYTADIEELKVIDILPSGYDGDEVLTRSESAKYLLKLLNMEPSPENEKEYSDLSEEHTYFHEVMTLVEMGYMSGYSDNTIMPDAPIKRAELVKIIIHMLNYKHMALANGGYPSGYMYIAARTELLQGAGKAPYEGLKKGEAARIFNNALDIPLVNLSVISDKNEYSIEKDKTLLTEYLKLKRDEGIITANDTYSVRRDALAPEEMIRIDGISYLPSSNKERTLVGCRVRYIYDIETPDEEIRKLVYVREQENNILTVNMEDFVSVSGNDITYELNETKNKVVRFSKSADIIYNSKNTTYDSSLLSSVIQGEIVLIDTDNDSIYDILKINEYYNIIANRINVKEKSVSDMEDPTKVISFDDEKKKVYIYDKNRNPVDFTFINYTSVISVMENTDYIEAYIGGDAVTGKITGIYEGADGYVTLSEKSFEFSPLLTDTSKAYLKVGNDVKLSLDMYGRVAYAKSYINNDIRFVYLIKPYEIRAGIENETYIKAYDTELGVTGLKFAEKTTVNGSEIRRITLSELKDKIKKTEENGKELYNQLVYVKLNRDNEITYLETVSALSENEEENENKFVCLSEAKERRLISSTNYAYEVYFQETTPILIIPKNPVEAESAEFQTRYPTDYSRNGRVLITMSAYTVNYNSGYADVLMIEGGATGGDIAKNAPMCVLVKINDAVTEEGDYAKKLYYLEEGEMKSSLLKDDIKYVYNSVIYKASELRSGDAFRISTNDKGEITNIETAYKASEKIVTAVQNGHEVASDYRMMLSEVKKIHGDFITVHYSDTQPMQKYIFDKQHFILVEKTGSGELRARKGSVLDIETGDTLLIHAYAATVRTVVIYKP